MARPTKKVAGSKFHRLTLLEPMEQRTPGGNYRWLCRCDCGQLTVVDSGAIGRIKSCGCYQTENMTANSPTKKLTQDQIEAIARDESSAKVLADRFGVSISHVYRIKRKRK